MSRLAMAVLTLFLVAVSLSAQPALPALEQEARQIDTMLIAPCCWRQPVSEHQSEAATEVKADVRRMLASGMGRQQVLDAFVAQYGERILASPPNRGFNRLLYAMPWIFGIGTAAGCGVFIRRVTRRRLPAESSAPQDAPADALDASVADQLDDELRDLD